jgi:hypothetical protein
MLPTCLLLLSHTWLLLLLLADHTGASAAGGA